MRLSPSHVDLDDRLGALILEAAIAREAPIDRDAVALDVEEMRRLAEHALRQQKERGVGAFIGVALRFLLLHLVEQARQTRIVLVERRRRAAPAPKRYSSGRPDRRRARAA